MKRGVSGRDEAANQLAVLRRLNQQAAAELVGVPVHTLRDWNAPRNEKDRSYDGRKLVKWLLAKERAKHKVVDTRKVEHELAQEKLKELRRKNEVEDRRWYPKAEVDGHLQAVFKRMAERARAIEVQHGAEIGALYREMVEEALAESNGVLGHTS